MMYFPPFLNFPPYYSRYNRRLAHFPPSPIEHKIPQTPEIKKENSLTPEALQRTSGVVETPCR